MGGKCSSRKEPISTPSKCSCCPCTSGKSTVVGYCRNCQLACCQLCSWWDNYKEQYKHTTCPLSLSTCRHCMETCCNKCSNYNSYKEYHSHRVCPPRQA